MFSAWLVAQRRLDIKHVYVVCLNPRVNALVNDKRFVLVPLERLHEDHGVPSRILPASVSFDSRPHTPDTLLQPLSYPEAVSPEKLHGRHRFSTCNL